MITMLLRIDKSVFHHGDYVGYANGVWHIRRGSWQLGRWQAKHRDNHQMQPLYAWSLAGLDAELGKVVAGE